MKLRKFDDFKKIYENNPGLMMGPGQPGELATSGTGAPVPENPPVREKPPVREIQPPPKRKIEPDRIEQPSKDPQRKAYHEEEEEGHESEIHNKLQSLAEELGAEITNNVIDYKSSSGKSYKIEFFSEPMCFNINGQTMQFLTTAEEVVDYLETEEQAGPSQVQSPNRPGQRFTAQSQKLPTGVSAQMANERKHNHSYKNRYR